MVRTKNGENRRISENIKSSKYFDKSKQIIIPDEQIFDINPIILTADVTRSEMEENKIKDYNVFYHSQNIIDIMNQQDENEEYQTILSDFVDLEKELIEKLKKSVVLISIKIAEKKRKRKEDEYAMIKKAIDERLEKKRKLDEDLLTLQTREKILHDELFLL